MSSSMSISGLASGIKSADIVAQLVSIEARPKQLLENKQANLQAQLGALRTLNTKVAGIATAAYAILGKADSIATARPELVWNASKGVSDNASVKIDAKPGAAIGDLKFDVKALATSQQSVVSKDAMSSLAGGEWPRSISIVVGDSITTIKPTSGSAQDIAAAINRARESGISATAVRVGDGEYMLQITSTSTGAKNNFQIFNGDITEAGGAAAGITPASSNSKDGATTYKFAQGAIDAIRNGTGQAGQLELNHVRQAGDAKITLWADNPSMATEVTSATNTFTNVLDKVDITVGLNATGTDGKTIDPLGKGISVRVEADPSVAEAKVSALVGSMNTVIQEIASRTRTVEAKKDDGTTYTTSGLLGTDTMTRNLRSGLSNLMSSGLKLEDGSYVSLSEFGIKLKSGGEGNNVLEFDAAKFKEAMNADPGRVEAMMSSFAQKAASFASDMSASGKGQISTYIESKVNEDKSLTLQIDNFKARLTKRQANLQAQFNFMEKMVAKYQSTGNWLAGQLKSLGNG